MRKIIITLLSAATVSFALFFFLLNFIVNFIIEVFNKTISNGNIMNPEKLDVTWDLFFKTDYYGFSGLLIVISLLAFAMSISSTFKFYHTFNKLNKNQKGSSRFATLKEIKEQYRDVPDKGERFEGSGGVPVARYKDRLFIDDSPVNNMFIGTTRSGKGEIFVISAIDIYSRAKKQSSMIINDPKGELFAASKETLEGLGYRVEVLNLMNPNQSMSYNLLEVVKQEFLLENYSQAQQYARSLAFMLYNDKKTADPIWSKASTNLCTALILGLCEVNKNTPEKITMYNLAVMFSELSSKIVKNERGEDEEGLVEFFKQFPINHPARLQFATYEGSVGATRASIRMNTTTPLGIFTLDSIGKLTSQNSMEMEKVGFNHWLKGLAKPLTRVHFIFNGIEKNSIKTDEKGYFKYYHDNHLNIGDNFEVVVGDLNAQERTIFKVESIQEDGEIIFTQDNNHIELVSCVQFEKPVAVFMIVPDYDETFNIIASLFVKQLYTALARAASNVPSGKCYREVVFLLDEFGNMPAIEGMSNIITVCLGRNIRFNLIIQSYSQLKELYGEQWSTIDGNCGNTMYLLTADKDTAETISSKLQDKTITTKSRSGKPLSFNKSKTESVDQRRLLTTAEVMGLKEGEMIVIRVIKRQDKKKKRIQQYPLFLTGETAMKYRWEYLSDYYDTNKSINDIEIPCSHAEISLRDLKTDYIVSHLKEEEEKEVVHVEVVEEIVKVFDVFGYKNVEVVERHILPRYKQADGSDRRIEYFLNMEIYEFLDILKRLVLSNLLEERIANIFIKAARQKGYDV